MGSLVSDGHQHGIATFSILTRLVDRSNLCRDDREAASAPSNPTACTEDGIQRNPPYSTSACLRARVLRMHHAAAVENAPYLSYHVGYED